MRHFKYLSCEEEERLFFSPPSVFSNRSDKETLAHAIGAALYMPATRQSIVDDIMTEKHQGLVSIVIDLEDAVGDQLLQLAEENLFQQMFRLSSLIHMGVVPLENLPLIFIRVRNPEQLTRIIHLLQDVMDLVTGFALPKFGVENGSTYLEIIKRFNDEKPIDDPTLYAMPILETADIIYQETRPAALGAIKQLLMEFNDYVLNVRIGATDFSSLFGLRKSRNMTVYDIAVIRDCIADIINLFGRSQDRFIISGPVSEHFKSEKTGRRLWQEYSQDYTDGFVREVLMDKENGIIGKTIIHPTHILPVQSLYAVTHEEYMDAEHIIRSNNGFVGVVKSAYSNKMNEIKPHLNWANRIMTRSNVYGVLNENKNFTSILLGNESLQQEHPFVSHS